jgi:hypothetical protein
MMTRARLEKENQVLSGIPEMGRHKAGQRGRLERLEKASGLGGFDATRVDRQQDIGR